MRMDDFVSVFKALGQPTRLNIIRLLAERDLCVCELTEILQTSQPRISQHLKVLKSANLVIESIEGSMRVYHLQRNQLSNYFSSFNSFLQEKAPDDKEMNDYLKRLADIGEDYRYNR